MNDYNANFLDEARFLGSNVAEGFAKDIPRFIDSLNRTADKASSGLIAGVQSVPGLMEGNFLDQFQLNYQRELAELQQIQQQNQTIGQMLFQNMGQPIAEVVDQGFDLLEGDPSKIRNAETKANVAQLGGSILAPAVGMHELGMTAKLGKNLFQQMKAGAKIGTGFGVLTGGADAENFQEYGKNILSGTAFGAAVPVASNLYGAAKTGAGKMVEFGKGTTNRIKSNIEGFKQDRITQSMNQIKSAQDQVIKKKMQQAQSKRVQPEGEKIVSARRINGKEVPREIVESRIKQIEAETGKPVEAGERDNFYKAVEDTLITENQQQRRRQIASQRLKELRMQEEIKSVQIKKNATEQQMNRIKQFLQERPKRLLPTEKQMMIRQKILRAEQLQKGMDTRLKQQLETDNLNQQFRASAEDMRAYEDVSKSINENISEKARAAADLQKQQGKIRRKVDRSIDGSIDNAIAGALKRMRASKAGIVKSQLEDLGKDPRIARAYAAGDTPETIRRGTKFPKRKQVGLDELKTWIEEEGADLSQYDDLEIPELIKEFISKYPTTPDQYFKDQAEIKYQQEVDQSQHEIYKANEEVTGLKQVLKEIAPTGAEPKNRENLRKFIERQNKKLGRAKNIQRSRANQMAKEELGLEDVSPAALKRKIAELDQERLSYEQQETSMLNNPELKKEALNFASEKIESEDFLKDVGLSYAAYEDGQMKVASFKNPNPEKRIKISKNDTKFTIQRDAEGKVTSIERPPTPVEKKYHEAKDTVFNQVDRVFGLSDDFAVINKQNVSESIPVSERFLKNSKWKAQYNTWKRDWWMPIQNVVDEISPALGKKVADLEASIANDPTVLLEEFATSTGLRQKGEFNPETLVKQIAKIFPEKQAYLNAAEAPEMLSPEQTDFLVKAQPFFTKYKDQIEATGIKFDELVNGLYAPRNILYKEWYSRQDIATQNAIKDKIKDLQTDYYDDDMVLADFTEGRKVEFVTDELLPMYHEAADNIVVQIKKIAKQRALQNFFGENLKKGNGHRKLISKMVDEQGITGSDARDAKIALERLFDKSPYTDKPVWNFFNKIRYATMLGGPSTAAKQPVLGGIRYSLRFGLENLTKAIATSNDPRFEPHFAKLLHDIEQGDVGTKLDLFDKVATGLFRMANNKEASLGLSSSYHWLAQNAAKAQDGKAPKSFTDYMTRRHGADEAQRLIQKFAKMKGKKYTGLDSDILNTTFTAARDRGSLAMTKADKVGKAIDKNSSDPTREFYKLMTYGLKDTNTLVDMTVGEITRGNAVEGYKNIFTQAAALMTLSGLATDQIFRVGSGVQGAASGEGFEEGYKRGGLQRTGEHIQESFMSLLPMVSRYGMEKLFDPESSLEAIANMVYKGLGTTLKLGQHSVKATSDSITKEGHPFGALDPDANPSFKHLPPKVITETYYNVVDPLLRGQESAVALKEAKRDQYDEKSSRDYQVKQEMELEKQYKKKGIPTKYAGTQKGSALYQKATNKKYQERTKALKRFDPVELQIGEEVRRELSTLSGTERIKAFNKLPELQRRGYLGAVLKKAGDAYIDGKIEINEYMRIEASVKDQAFPSSLDRIKRGLGIGK